MKTQQAPLGGTLGFAVRAQAAGDARPALGTQGRTLRRAASWAARPNDREPVARGRRVQRRPGAMRRDAARSRRTRPWPGAPMRPLGCAHQPCGEVSRFVRGFTATPALTSNLSINCAVSCSRTQATIYESPAPKIIIILSEKGI